MTNFLKEFTATPITPAHKFNKNGMYTECNALEDLNDSYIVAVCKEDKGWIVFGEDHEPSEISKMYDVPVFFKTKKQALEVARELLEDMYNSVFAELYKGE